MQHLPLVVGFGGINAAGRSSGHNGYKRTVIDALAKSQVDATWQSLSALMQCDANATDYMRKHTLVRRIEEQYFDPDRIPWNRAVNLAPSQGQRISFELSKRDVPEVVPADWQIQELEGGRLRVTVDAAMAVTIQDHRKLGVSCAAQLPTGFDPAALYQSRNHPRGLQLAIVGISDALGSMGLDWDEVSQSVRPDQISMYSSSAIGQMDETGSGGLLGARLRGKRVTSKQLALGLPQMTADFPNAYVLGHIGTTGGNIGACATFHYNLRLAVDDIQSGRAKIAIAGSSEAPITPEQIDGFMTMGAMATDENLAALDGLASGEKIDYTRTCRPFGENCGLAIGEASQYVILMADDLALELGASIYGAVPGVFVNADGHKKSISGPGVGNYITFAKAAALAKSLLDERGFKEQTLAYAHGTGTPQNRTSESHIFNETAKAFGASDWLVPSIKCFVGHTMGPAGGDQLASALGVAEHGVVPGIVTSTGPADDVHHSHLRIASEHTNIGAENFSAALLNAKGFGGNNATAVMLSTAVVKKMLNEKHGSAALTRWQHSSENARQAVSDYDAQCSRDGMSLTYRFGHDVRDGSHIHIDENELRVDGYKQAIKLKPQAS